LPSPESEPEPFTTPALAAAFTAAQLVVVVPLSSVMSMACAIGECTDRQTTLMSASFFVAPLVVVAFGIAAAVRRRGRLLVVGGVAGCLVALAPLFVG
jgi:hypothetical protein